METSAIGVATPTTQQRGVSDLASEDFFKILVAEMQNQDPLAPSDSSDLISQVAQIRTIEQSDLLTNTLGLLTEQQRMGGATGLIGKFVQAIVPASDGTETLCEGVVTSVYFNSDGSAVLELDTGQAIAASDVLRVTTLDEVERELTESSAGSDEGDETNEAADEA
jgi:flagellar basal-body rod modification protein FlgD